MSDLEQECFERASFITDDESCPLSNIYRDFLCGQKSFSMYHQPWNPPTDIYETSDMIIIKMELAGVDQKNIDVTLDKQDLIIQGRREEEARPGKKDYHLMEIHYGIFKRAFRLNYSLNRDEIKASYQNGFLLVYLPKKSSTPSQVEIKGE